MRLSILVLTLRSRKKLFERLRRRLDPQLARYRDEVELLVERDNGEASSGTKRNRLLAKAQGRYFTFVDDDDMISEDYVESLLTAMDNYPDVHVITFKVRIINEQTGKSKIQCFSTRFEDFGRSQSYEQMTANHLCAWRRDIGTRLQFPTALGYLDDVFWYKPLIASQLAQTEVILNKILYEYIFDPAVSVNQRKLAQQAARKWAGRGIEYFFDKESDELLVALASIDRCGDNDTIDVRDRHGTVLRKSRKSMRRFYVCKYV
jgi:glycosyltransferase involved in cell wall biosynthesis